MTQPGRPGFVYLPTIGPKVDSWTGVGAEAAGRAFDVRATLRHAVWSGAAVCLTVVVQVAGTRSQPTVSDAGAAGFSPPVRP